MSYYRYITGTYRSYWPDLNRSLRSCSAPRHIPEAVPSRISRASSVPPSTFYSTSYFNRGRSATPYRDRSVSVPRQLSYSYDSRSIVTPPPATHYSDFDYKVMDYMGRLDREDTVKSNITRSRIARYVFGVATTYKYPICVILLTQYLCGLFYILNARKTCISVLNGVSQPFCSCLVCIICL